MICHLAYEFGIAPDEVERQSPRMLATMYRYLRWRAVEANQANQRRSSRGG